MPSPVLPSGMPTGSTTFSPMYTPVAWRPFSSMVATSIAAAMRSDSGRSVRSICPPMTATS